MTRVLIPRAVLIDLPKERPDLSPSRLPPCDIEGIRIANRLRIAFNNDILGTLKAFAREQDLEDEVDFTASRADISGFSFSCTARFAGILRQRQAAPDPRFTHLLAVVSEPDRLTL